MKLLISPAKKMREDGDFLAPRQAPALLERAAVLAEWPSFQRIYLQILLQILNLKAQIVLDPIHINLYDLMVVL